jgi:hypothetical protein
VKNILDREWDAKIVQQAAGQLENLPNFCHPRQCDGATATLLLENSEKQNN